MKHITTISIVFLAFCLNAQTIINGTVTHKDGTSIIGANVFIEGSYDGTVTDIDGKYSFETSLTGEQTISISYLGFESKTITADIAALSGLTIKLRESAMSLDAVEITASNFKAGDNSKVAVLTPLDIVTTAGSMGDVVAAMQNLPGTQTNGEDGRLFVRGGDANETKIYIDGLRVFSPYTRTISGTPVRGRYSPFLFKGVSFSTGGYSAAFGQALSGVLDLNTIDDPKDTETNISIMSVGLGLGQTTKFKESSLSISASYIDLTPYYALVKSRLDLTEPYRGFSGESVYRHKIGKGLLKSYIAGDFQRVRVEQFDIDAQSDQTIKIDNYNFYANNSYSSTLNENTSLQAGVSYGINRDKFTIEDSFFGTNLVGVNTRVALKNILSDYFIINYGLDHVFQKDGFETYDVTTGDDQFENNISRHISAAFAESDYFFSKKLAVKLGLRLEHNSNLNITDLSPRITLAQKLSDNSQMSMAYGLFTQEVASDFLYYNPVGLQNELASHYLINYNFKSEKHILRLEGYYKNYDRLIKYDGSPNFPTNINVDGYGKAYGLDFFWKSNKTIKNVDFWVSYSWGRSERLFKDYPSVATPSFSTEHNLSLVGKKWFDKLKSQLSFTYQFASGRPFENPNTIGFMNERSKPFHNMSASWAYLISQQKILFVSVSNFPGFRNEFGNRYGSIPDINGVFPSQAIRPNEDRFFFIGFFLTISKDKTKNQLDNL